MTCNDAEPLIARFADDEPSLAEDVREQLRAHITSCAACRTALDEQRDTAALLRARLVTLPEPGLAARVSARIDRESRENRKTASQREEGWFGVVNWRAWTVGLAPVAAALIVAAYVDLGSARSASVSPIVSPTVTATLDEWTLADAPAALQSSAIGDALIEAVLTGNVPTSGDADVR
jgi:predicted anti-sigma-YlaC factor YlaD